MTDVMVVAGARTAIGDYGGAFKDVPPTKLGAIAIREALARAKAEPASVGHVVMGSVIHGEARDMYLSRVAAVDAGIPVSTPALTVNRLCGSGLQAIVSAAQHIMLGDCHIAVAGGAESMSRAAYMLPSGRWGQRRDAKMEDLAKLKAVFKKDGTVTAANASGINDAAAAVVLMHAKAAKNQKPIARLVAYAHAGVDPQLMGLGPIPAVKRVFEKAGLKPADMDVIESNEAFAVQAMAVTRDLGLDPAKVNPNGGAGALGHPIGATGCILTPQAVYELHRTGKRYALVTMCIGGGQGIAAIFERI